MSACTRSHIVVTGTSSGIGRATALYLAAAGHHVYAGVRRPADAPPPTSADLGEIIPLPLDVADPVQVTAAADTVAGHTGNAGLHGLVNNAGIGVFGPLELIPVKQFRRLLEVNVTGQLAVTQALLPLLRRARGRIIMIGSIGARFTPPFVGPLAASKTPWPRSARHCARSWLPGTSAWWWSSPPASAPRRWASSSATCGS
jgi:NAD(P)-dependent dehydrogenase (short-subunit alcohol dehydrogenase family)